MTAIDILYFRSKFRVIFVHSHSSHDFLQHIFINVGATKYLKTVYSPQKIISSYDIHEFVCHIYTTFVYEVFLFYPNTLAPQLFC